MELCTKNEISSSKPFAATECECDTLYNNINIIFWPLIVFIFQICGHVRYNCLNWFLSHFVSWQQFQHANKKDINSITKDNYNNKKIWHNYGPLFKINTHRCLVGLHFQCSAYSWTWEQFKEEKKIEDSTAVRKVMKVHDIKRMGYISRTTSLSNYNMST